MNVGSAACTTEGEGRGGSPAKTHRHPKCRGSTKGILA